VGKTRLAIEYAWRHASDYTALLFVSARSPVELRANLAGLCNPLVLNLPEQTQPEEAARVSAVLRWLGENPGRLLILDSADTQEAASAVEETLPRLRGGQLIITTRIADWSPAVQTVEPLNVLDETEAAEFLLEPPMPSGAEHSLTLRRRWRWRARWADWPWRWNKRALTLPKTAYLFPNTCSAGSRGKPRCSPGTTNA
jgi:hypothetical protein